MEAAGAGKKKRYLALAASFKYHEFYA